MFSINKILRKHNRSIKDIEYKGMELSEYIIIDVRSKREYNEGHIKGAINIPLEKIKNEIENIITDKNKKVLLYCKSGIRSKKAGKILEQKGYKNICNLKGGIDNN